MSTNINIPVMKSVAECSEMFGISQRYCRYLVKSQAVRAVRVGRGKFLINVQSMIDYFNNASVYNENDSANHVIKPIPV